MLIAIVLDRPLADAKAFRLQRYCQCTAEAPLEEAQF
jgi:hypothetical protein